MRFNCKRKCGSGYDIAEQEIVDVLGYVILAS
jgi:hypothetical protein